jgi:hypothetical protein
MQQKTKGIVTSKISLTKTRPGTARQVIENLKGRSGINIVKAEINADGAEIVVTYGPVWGGQEYDVRKKMTAAMNKVKCAGQVSYDSKRLAVESR